MTLYTIQRVTVTDRDGTSRVIERDREAAVRIASFDDKTTALMVLLYSMYQRPVTEACMYIDAHPDVAASFSERPMWFTRPVVEVGFSSQFRALQVLHGLSLEDLMTRLRDDTDLWFTLRRMRVTLDIVYAPASDPAPPFDQDTDCVIAVVPEDAFGASRFSRFHAR